MTSSHSRPASRAFLLPLALIVAAAAFRWAKLKGLITFEALENFTPWMALAFTGTLIFSKRVPFLLIPLLLAAVDIAATGLHKEALTVYLCFGIAALLASRCRGRMGMVGTMLGVAGCSLVFYLTTNTVAWLSNPAYACCSWLPTTPKRPSASSSAFRCVSRWPPDPPHGHEALRVAFRLGLPHARGTCRDAAPLHLGRLYQP